MSFKSVLLNINQLKKKTLQESSEIEFLMENNILRLDAVYSMLWKPHYGGHFDIHGNMLESSENKNKRWIIYVVAKIITNMYHMNSKTPQTLG